MIDLLSIATDGLINKSGKFDIVAVATGGYVTSIKIGIPKKKGDPIKIEPEFSPLFKDLPLEEQLKIEEEEVLTIIIMFLNYVENNRLF